MRERNKWLVLVVEDEPDLLALITRVLEKNDYEVLTATNGHEGLAMASARPKPALIISDIMMPDMDGLQMVKAIKGDPAIRHTPIIFLTAKDTPQDVINGIKAGARHYISKPFKVADLVDKVKAILRPLQE